MKNVIYLCLGGGIVVEQTQFSIASAYRFRVANPGEIRFVIYTDTPDRFAGLPVSIETVDQARIDQWLVGTGFLCRCKILAIEDALRRWNEPCLLVDTDTYFKRWPGAVFDRIGPGRSVMHQIEGLPRSWGRPEIARFVEEEPVQEVNGTTWTLAADEVMWNAGVIGLSPTDQALCRDVLAWSDLIWQRTQAWISEQYAFTVVLSQKTRRQETDDLIMHYWTPSTKSAFNALLPAILEQTASLPLAARARQLWKYRPILPLLWRIKVAIKLRAKRMGLKRGLPLRRRPIA